MPLFLWWDIDPSFSTGVMWKVFQCFPGAICEVLTSHIICVQVLAVLNYRLQMKRLLFFFSSVSRLHIWQGGQRWLQRFNWRATRPGIGSGRHEDSPPPRPRTRPFPSNFGVVLLWSENCYGLLLEKDKKKKKLYDGKSELTDFSSFQRQKGPLCCLNTAKILQARATSWLKLRREPPITSRHVSLRWPADATPWTCLRNVWYFTSKWVSFDRMLCLTAVNHEMSAHTSARLPWGLCQRPCSCLIIHRLWSCLTFSSLCCSFKEGTCLYLQMKPGLDAARF